MEAGDTGEVATVPARVGVGKVTFETRAAGAIDTLVGVGLADNDA